jgi:hypothetical protein
MAADEQPDDIKMGIPKQSSCGSYAFFGRAIYVSIKDNICMKAVN